MLNIFILLALALVVWQLAVALRAMSRGAKGDPQQLLQALKRRVILSILIVAALFVMGALGLIEPHGLST
ncbi:DUF2909 family protein [Perlucidibaca piscinae]|uniref:DUF2909 family protein n=1 Tax=Perlucidibaca piscinae TaxID=392589 RepID=UPI0003B6097C|nr:DUF2909 family protein [Perlucidibaca piscinae]